MKNKLKLRALKAGKIERAIKSGSFKEFKCLVTSASDFNVILYEKHGSLPIHVAAESGRLDILIFLLAKGVDIDKTDRDGCTPLHYAVKSGQLAVINHLIQKSVNVCELTLDDEKKYIPLDASNCEKSELQEVFKWVKKVLKKVIFSNAKSNVRNLCSGIPLNKSVYSQIGNDVETMIGLKNNFNIADKVGNTPLHVACDEVNEAAVSLLLNGLEKIPEAERNISGVNKYGNTPLHNACQKGNETIVSLLLNALEKIPAINRNLSLVNNSGTTPLYVACYKSNRSLVRLLLNALEKIPETMRNLNKRTGKYEDTPLHIACKRGDTSIVSHLLDAGARSDIKNHNGEKAVYLFLLQKHYLGQHELTTLKKISSFTDINERRISAAHFALSCRSYGLEINKTIIRLQKNINVFDIWGDTPLNYLTHGPMRDLEEDCNKIKLLINYGAFFTSEDCKKIIDNYSAQNILFTDVELCAQSCLNKLVNEALLSLYYSPLATQLPKRDRLILDSAYLQKIENIIEAEIKFRGYCDFKKNVYPLFYLSVVRLSNYYKTTDCILSPIES